MRCSVDTQGSFAIASHQGSTDESFATHAIGKISSDFIPAGRDLRICNQKGRSWYTQLSEPR